MPPKQDSPKFITLTHTPLRQRKFLLEDLCEPSGSRGVVRYSEHFEGDGDAFFKHACEHGIEGIVSKLADFTLRVNASNLSGELAKQPSPLRA